MPELPEVETVLRGLTPHLVNQTVKICVLRRTSLRWPIPLNLPDLLENQTILACSRRAKYFLMQFAEGSLLIHLGMSGRLCLVAAEKPVAKHDHVDIVLQNEKILRFTDPRRFGCILWIDDIFQHRLLKNLGPEPLSREFSGQHLFQQIQRRKLTIKTLIMNQHCVVGVGNIYASEALFKAGLHPKRLACSLTQIECNQLVKAIKQVLKSAIKAGGTTLKDFVNGSAAPGYFQQSLAVYGREKQACKQCDHLIQKIQLNQRSTFFCENCQNLGGK